MRISDWSSDVCSSDLHVSGRLAEGEGRAVVGCLEVSVLERRRVERADLEAERVGAGLGLRGLGLGGGGRRRGGGCVRGFGLSSEEHTSELQCLKCRSYAGL